MFASLVNHTCAHQHKGDIFSFAYFNLLDWKRWELEFSYFEVQEMFNLTSSFFLPLGNKQELPIFCQEITVSQSVQSHGWR